MPLSILDPHPHILGCSDPILGEWDGYCRYCGHTSEERAGDDPRACRCGSCGARHTYRTEERQA